MLHLALFSGTRRVLMQDAPGQTDSRTGPPASRRAPSRRPLRRRPFSRPARIAFLSLIVPLIAVVALIAVRSEPLFAAARAAAAGAAPAGASTVKAPPRSSAVLFIGDGMGPSYVTATRVALGGSGGHLHLDEMPYTALVRTWSADSPVTDSAAAVTAMACGRKTVNGVLGQDASAIYGKKDGRPLESIAAWGKKHGLRVGLVTTTRVTHATPAGFYASVNDRDRERAIARQAIAAPIDLLLGGGEKFFAAGAPEREEDGWDPADKEDLEAAARSRGWVVARTASEMQAIGELDHPVLGLFGESHLPYEARSPAPPDRHGAPTLEQMTRFAIGALRKTGAPFFLMVEGGRIDHAGHSNWARTLIDETAAFDSAIGAALTGLDPKTTLVLVTADHDTGGLAINGYPDEKDGILGTVRDAEGEPPHSVLTFASGPGIGGNPDEAPYGAEDPRPSGIALEAAVHTGIDVALYGWGAGADQVRGTLDNTAVYELLAAHLQGRKVERDRLARPPR